MAPAPRGSSMYYVLAAVGLFTLLVGTSVRLKRPRDQATLHFFWLCVAFFGAFTFSFIGPFDRLDWVFYWGDAVAQALLPPLLLHFTLVFPQRPPSAIPYGRTNRVRVFGAPAVAEAREQTARVESVGPGLRTSDALVPLIYLPALVLGAARIVALGRGSSNGELFSRVIEALDRLEPLYLLVCAIAALVVLVRGFRQMTSPTARRQLRWIAWGTALGVGPFAFGYALPWALGIDPPLALQLTAIPARLRAADVCISHRPLPAPGCRGHRQARARLHGVRRGDCGAWAGHSEGCFVDLSHRRRSAELDHRGAGDDRDRAAGPAGERGRAERARSGVLPRSLRLPPGARCVRTRSEHRSRCCPARAAPGVARGGDAGGRSDGAHARARRQ